MKYLILFSFLPFLSSAQNELLFSEYGEGNAFNKWVEIYNPTTQNISLDNYRYNFCWNGCDSLAWEFSISFDSGYVIASGETYLLTHFNADSILLNLANQTTNLMSNGNDVIGLYNTSLNEVIDIIGVFDSISPANGWNIDTTTNATKNHTIFRKPDICFPNQGDWSASDGSNTAAEWIVNIEDDFSSVNTHSSNCLTTSNVLDASYKKKKLLKVIDLLGREITNQKTNHHINLYLYDNGNVDKIIKLD